MGELAALASALTFSVTAIIEKSLTKRLAPPNLAALGSLGGALFMLALMFATGKPRELPSAPLDSILLSISGGVISIAVGYSLYLWFLRSVDVSKAAPLGTGLFALFAVIAGLFVLGERLSGLTLVGIAAIISGVYMLSLSQRGRVVSTEAKWLGFKGVAFMVLVAVLWVAGWSLQKRALEDLDVLIANGLRLPVVNFFLMTFASAGVGRSLVGRFTSLVDEAKLGHSEGPATALGPTIREVDVESTSPLIWIASLLNGAVSFGLGSLLLLIALDRTGLAITMVLNNTGLLFIALFSVVFLRERVSLKTLIGIVVTLLGVAVVLL